LPSGSWTGLLAAPVLAVSAAYGIGEAFRWPTGLDRTPNQARAFYGAIAAAIGAGVLLNFTPVNPIEALFWSAVVNGVIAVPIMGLMMLMATNPRVMGAFTIGWPLKILGWLSTAVMALAAAGMIALSF
jgi:Mn2+/Fe2+ NRAMP family transporter